MTSAKALTALQSWSSVAKWTVFGTSACVVVAVVFNAIFFGDLGRAAWHRSLISAVVLPVLLGVTLFFYLSTRLRGLAIGNRHLGLMARTDSLTACLNRGAFTTKVSLLLAQQAPSQAGALLMIDADNFKAINDRYGHDSGDQALTLIARSVRAVLSPGDLVGRMGGEEFGVFLPNVDHRQAEVMAERIRGAVNLAVFTPDGPQRTLSVSIGGAVFTGPASFSQLFRIADQQLYSAKHTGRNRATLVNIDDHPPIVLRRSA